MDNLSSIGHKIRAFRKEKGLSQSALADLIDISTESISNLERGIHRPTFETMIKISEQLNIPLGNFVDDAPDNKMKSSRRDMIAELNAIAHNLSDTNLEVAINQMRAFKQKKK